MLSEHITQQKGLWRFKTDRTRVAGRPRKGDAYVPYDEIDTLLVYGEMVEQADGKTALSFPTYREIAKRYGVANSLIARYAKQHDCMRRRTTERMRLTIKTDHKLLELRAKTMAYSADGLGFGEIGDASAHEPLVAALRDKNDYVRSEAAVALGRIGDAGVVPALEELARDENPSCGSTRSWP